MVLETESSNGLWVPISQNDSDPTPCSLCYCILENKAKWITVSYEYTNEPAARSFYYNQWNVTARRLYLSLAAELLIALSSPSLFLSVLRLVFHRAAKAGTLEKINLWIWNPFAVETNEGGGEDSTAHHAAGCHLELVPWEVNVEDRWFVTSHGNPA